MKIVTAPSSNPKNGSNWRDLHQTDAHYSPCYIGEAKDQETANLFAAAPDLLAAVKALLRCQDIVCDESAGSTEAAVEMAQAAVRKAVGV